MLLTVLELHEVDILVDPLDVPRDVSQGVVDPVHRCSVLVRRDGPKVNRETRQVAAMPLGFKKLPQVINGDGEREPPGCGPFPQSPIVRRRQVSDPFPVGSRAAPAAIDLVPQSLVANGNTVSTGTETDPEAQSKSIAEAFQQMELDPDVTRRTLGHAFTRVGPDSILATTRKLLAVSRGEQEPDDRDSMAYQSLMGQIGRAHV